MCMSQGIERATKKRTPVHQTCRHGRNGLPLTLTGVVFHRRGIRAAQPARIWAAASVPMPCHLPFLASCSHSFPACYPGLLPVQPPLPHTWHLSLPHVSPAGYGIARAHIRQAWRCHPHGLGCFFLHHTDTNQVRPSIRHAQVVSCRVEFI